MFTCCIAYFALGKRVNSKSMGFICICKLEQYTAGTVGPQKIPVLLHCFFKLLDQELEVNFQLQKASWFLKHPEWVNV